MDRTEIARRIERAEKLLQKGKTADALGDYLLVLESDPENDIVRQMAADLCLSLQRTSEAVRLLGELFDRQVQAGDATRASLTYKKLSRSINPTWQQKMRFGQLLEGTNRKLALQTYEAALEELLKQQRKQDALTVAKRIVEFDPTERNLLRLGELSSDAGQITEAAAAFRQLAQLAATNGGNAAQWLERAYQEDPSDPQIALDYGKDLLNQGQVGAAIFVLEPHVNVEGALPELRDTYARALLLANRLGEAETILWQLFEQDPSRQKEIADLIGLFIDSDQDPEAVALARKLEQFQRRKGERRGFLTTMQEITASRRASPELLEFMSELFNASNREGDYCQTLLKLFDLHFGTGNFDKAGECLDRAAEVDPYEPGHQKRLELLHGKIDENRYKMIAARFSSASTNRTPPGKTEERLLGAAALQDLILQAEILVQYGMRSKAIERLQHIKELFPGEAEHNEVLQRLYLAAGMSAEREAPTLPPLQAPAVVAPGPVVPTSAPVSSEAADVATLTKVSEITSKLYRQSNASALLATAVKEIGGHWKADRCIVAMRKPGQPATAMKEMCGQDVQPGSPGALTKLIAAAHDVAIGRGTLTLSEAMEAIELASVHDALGQLGVGSLLALPLLDGQENVGVLMLTSGSPRSWRSSDIVVLRTLGEQIVIAMNNAGLRRLVKNLSVTDEKSGLLKRASYLDLLMSEARRSVQQSAPLTVLLLQFGKRSALIKEFGEPAVNSVMQQVGQIFAANLRQNDFAFRYEMNAVALILGDTAEKEAALTVEKLRKLAAEVKVPEKDVSLVFTTGVAEAVVRQNFDAADIVTEVINRAELALDMANAQGPGKVVALAPSYATAAVA